MISVGKGRAPGVTTTATAAPEPPPPVEEADGGRGPGGPRQQQPQPQETVAAKTQSLAASHVSVRGTAPKVSAAGALLLERLKVREAGTQAHERLAGQPPGNGRKEKLSCFSLLHFVYCFIFFLRFRPRTLYCAQQCGTTAVLWYFFAMSDAFSQGAILGFERNYFVVFP